MKKFTLSALAIFAMFAVNAQLAAPVTQNQTVTVTLNNKIEISIESATGTSLTFDDASDYVTGVESIEASEFRVRSNQNFAISVKANTADFTSSSATAMPAGVLAVRKTGAASYTTLTTGNQTLFSDTKGNKTFKVDYKADPGYLYDAGAYSLVVVYTATQQ